MHYEIKNLCDWFHCCICYISWSGAKSLKYVNRASLVAQLVKNLPAIQETPVQFLGREDPMERVGYPLQYSWASLVAQMVKNPPAMWESWVRSWVEKIPGRRACQPTPVFLPRDSPWTQEPGGLQSMGSQRVRHDWVTQHSTVCL